MSEAVYVAVARDFARQKDVAENKVQPLAEIICAWHREFPDYAVMGILSGEAIAFGAAIRRDYNRQRRRRIMQEENRVRAKIKRYVVAEVKKLKGSDRMAIGVGVEPLTWIAIACWAWQNRKLIEELIARIRELLAHDPFSRERVLS